MSGGASSSTPQQSSVNHFLRKTPVALSLDTGSRPPKKLVNKRLVGLFDTDEEHTVVCVWCWRWWVGRSEGAPGWVAGASCTAPRQEREALPLNTPQTSA